MLEPNYFSNLHFIITNHEIIKDIFLEDFSQSDTQEIGTVVISYD